MAVRRQVVRASQRTVSVIVDHTGLKVDDQANRTFSNTVKVVQKLEQVTF